MNGDQQSDKALFRALVDVFERFMSVAKPTACYGEPVPVGDRTIIPTADVMCTVGIGLGAGEGKPEGDEGGKPEGSSGSGGGGGGFTRSRPVAVVVVAADGVTVEPVIDATQIAMAGVAAGAFLGFWLMRIMRVTQASTRGGPTLKSIKETFKA